MGGLVRTTRSIFIRRSLIIKGEDTKYFSPIVKDCSTACYNDVNFMKKMSTSTFALESDPKLVKIPSLPYIGSLLPFYSKAPVRDLKDDREFFRIMREKFGDFYTYGIPGLGEGSHGTLYCKLTY